MAKDESHGPWEIRIKSSAERELRKLPKADLRRIVRRISQLAADPRPAGSEKLHGENGYRMRQVDYRILYVVNDDLRLVEVIEIGHRKDVYR